MASKESTPHRANPTVDVELPLGRPSALDVDLSRVQATAAAERRFRPSLSQLAADLSLARMRWPSCSRSGYHGASDWNWMRDGRAGFAEQTVPGR